MEANEEQRQAQLEAIASAIRRASVGLETFEEYTEQMNLAYQQSKE